MFNNNSGYTDFTKLISDLNNNNTNPLLKGIKTGPTTLLGIGFNDDTHSFINLGTEFDFEKDGSKLQELGYKPIQIGNAWYGVKDKNFFQRNASTINGIGATIGIAGGLANTFFGIKNAITQNSALKTQSKALKEQLREAKNEYSRISAIRKKLNESY